MINNGLDTAPCLYFCFSEEGVILEVNQLFCATVGKALNEIIDLPFDRFLSVSSRIAFHTNWKPTLHLQNEVNELQINLIAANNEQIPVVVNARRTSHNGQTMVECIGIAIPGRQKTETDMVAARKAYEAALSTNVALSNARIEIERQIDELNDIYNLTRRQNIELSQINKIVTHDLQEPIRKILFNTEQLTVFTDSLPAPITSALQRLVSHADNLRGKLKGLQEYIWLTEINNPFSTVDLNEVLRDAMGNLRRQYGEDSFLIESVDLPSINGDSGMLSALFFHILENAIVFSGEKSVASIKIRCTGLTRNSLQNLAGHYRYNDYIRIDISDSGQGIDAGVQEQVFDLFYKSKDSRGVGLGLALSKKIVEHHDGNISVSSPAAKGTQFSIVLPVSQNKRL
ncbi:MAG: PAS domain-containing sensor histidine kinase [Chitinophagaceae bacterium]|nr:MAG: PAS domain-containing sensor histidine kinase [Chitinophagaceae bacterium]